MNNSAKYVSIFIILSACQDQLTKAPLDSPASATFFSNQKELDAAINGVYTGLWWEASSSIPPVVQLLDLMTDIGMYRGGGGGIVEMASGGHSSSSELPTNTWIHFYSAIAKANNLLQNMHRAEDKVSADYLIQIEAEARFLRAFFYHWLTELYGDVPLLTEVPELENAQIGRSPKSEVVAQIMADLDFAAQNLSPRAGGDKGLASRGAALTLKARSALYNEDYDTAIEAAQSVMESGEYELYPDYEQQFKYEGKRSSEVILDMPLRIGIKEYSSPVRLGTRNGGGTSEHVPTQYLVDSYHASDGLPIDQSPLYDPANPFENRDPRLDATIVRPQSIFVGYVFETHPDSIETWRIVDGDSIRVENLDTTNPFASYTGYCWRKYSGEDLPRRETELNPIYIRYAEVLLIYAEAMIESGNIDQTVLDAMNQVRARGYGVDPSQTSDYPAIITTNQEELRREVRYERKIELAGEGFRWFDITRWGIADVVRNGNVIGRPVDAYSTIPSPPEIQVDAGHHPDYGQFQDLYRNVRPRSFDSNRDWLWPIPQEEIDINEEIEQNPGY